MTWFEALPPLIIVCAGVAGIGTLQGIAHRAYYGKDKKVQRDHFSHLMEKRDARIEASEEKTSSK